MKFPTSSAKKKFFIIKKKSNKKKNFPGQDSPGFPKDPGKFWTGIGRKKKGAWPSSGRNSTAVGKKKPLKRREKIKKKEKKRCPTRKRYSKKRTWCTAVRGGNSKGVGADYDTLYLSTEEYARLWTSSEGRNAGFLVRRNREVESRMMSCKKETLQVRWRDEAWKKNKAKWASSPPRVSRPVPPAGKGKTGRARRGRPTKAEEKKKEGREESTIFQQRRIS